MFVFCCYDKKNLKFCKSFWFVPMKWTEKYIFLKVKFMTSNKENLYWCCVIIINKIKVRGSDQKEAASPCYHDKSAADSRPRWKGQEFVIQYICNISIIYDIKFAWSACVTRVIVCDDKVYLQPKTLSKTFCLTRSFNVGVGTYYPSIIWVNDGDNTEIYWTRNDL